jgi:hypothetical protein
MDRKKARIGRKYSCNAPAALHREKLRLPFGAYTCHDKLITYYSQGKFSLSGINQELVS